MQSFIVSDLSVRLTRVLPEYRYELDYHHGPQSSNHTPEEATIHLTELPSHVQSIIEAALTPNTNSNRELSPSTYPSYGANSVPEELVQFLSEYDYIECTWHDGSVGPTPFELFENDFERPSLLEFDATLIQNQSTPDDPAVIEFSLTNRGTESIIFRRSKPWPFNVPIAYLQPDEEVTLELWNDQYSEIYPVSRYESVHPYLYIPNEESGEITPTETITAEYLVPFSDEIPSGKYLYCGYFKYIPTDCRQEVIRYEITFEIIHGY